MENINDINSISARLKAFFPAAAIKWRVGMKEGDAATGLRGQALPYIDSRDVQERLDEVVGAGGWENMMKPSSVGVICGIKILVNGYWVLKEDGAHVDEYKSGSGYDNNSKELAVKGAFSDSFKRAAVMWGIARYLYAYKAEMVDLDKDGKFLTQPSLPQHLLLPEDIAALAETSVAVVDTSVVGAAAQVEADAKAAAAAAAAQVEAEAKAAAAAAAAQVEAEAKAAAAAAAAQVEADAKAAAAAAAAQVEADAKAAAAAKATAAAVATKAAADAKAAVAAAAAAAAVVDADAAGRRARADALADSAAAQEDDSSAEPAPVVAAAQADGESKYDFSALNLPEAEAKTVSDLIVKVRSDFPFLIMHQFLTSPRGTAKLSIPALNWLRTLNFNEKASPAERLSHPLVLAVAA